MTLDELVSLKNLNEAFYECSKASKWKESTQRYQMNLLLNNITLRDEVLNGTYKVGKTVDFIINERGKKREIHAPIFRDRVLQKVVVKHILLPYLTKSLIYDNYASLKKRGTSFARKRFDILLRRYMNKYGTDGYILQIDIQKYFDSIDHGILKQMIHDKIHEPQEIMNLLDYLIDTSSSSNIGLNLGAEAPQIFAIYYISSIDSWLKIVKQIKYYGRYMDDIFIILNNKQELKSLLIEIQDKLNALKLKINNKKTQIIKLKHGFVYLQIKYSINRDRKIIKRPTRAKITRERRRLKRFKGLSLENRMQEYDIQNCYKSWRQSIIIDCRNSRKSVQSTDTLFKSLFPNVLSCIKQNRNKVINKIFKEEAEHENLRYIRQRINGAA